MKTLTIAEDAATFETLAPALWRENAGGFDEARSRVDGMAATGSLNVDREILLDANVVRLAGGTARRLTSQRAADMKRWIGILDTELDRGVFDVAVDAPRPDPAALALAAEADRDAALADLRHAMAWYLYGYAREAAMYEDILDRYLAPFVTDAYALDCVNVLESGRLVVSGYPTLLLARNVRIHEGGTIVVRSTIRADIETLEKLGA